MTNISDILNRKGRDVATIRPEATLRDAVHELTERNIGALVVSSDGRSLQGIISERDVVRQLVAAGTDALGHTVRDAMSADVVTCTQKATVDDLMGTMTERRVRHIPVVEGDTLVGLVSIGDVVKSRIVELEVQTQALENYVSGTAY